MREIADKVYWAGKVDDRKVPFHRLILEKGTSYNAYLIRDEKTALIDTVDMLYGKEFVDSLGREMDLMALDYIIVNHTEPDHSGALGALARKAKNAKIVCTAYAVYELMATSSTSEILLTAYSSFSASAAVKTSAWNV